MGQAEANPIECAMSQIPCGSYILTAAFEDSSAGVLVHWVQRCSQEPPMVAVALGRGHMIEPLIRDSRAFALCQISDGDQFLGRRFSTSTTPCETRSKPNAGQPVDDALISLAVRLDRTGSPIIERALSYVECSLSHNLDLDGDHRLYIGLVLGGGMMSNGKPAVFFGDNGSALR